MISWGKLTYCLAAISKPPNGGGAEISFSLNGKSYIEGYKKYSDRSGKR